MVIQPSMRGTVGSHNWQLCLAEKPAVQSYGKVVPPVCVLAAFCSLRSARGGLAVGGVGLEMWSAPPTALENLELRVPLTPSRTHNRMRSPR
ncbi:hypothetical protein CBR_g58142 [Chara braunii]|uniref:Uncharacterized protein n=1 Tax=Chara braunii TaxID=69332 RepID=A0A388MEM4_CHABU|nr:hypothetical protein CBR_g58142 [Chara braunii]|eukprot:GBG93004.1 hypothetical protein CBR_g58142 [Chara braunii]